jgi:hypothetical protein
MAARSGHSIEPPTGFNCVVERIRHRPVQAVGGVFGVPGASILLVLELRQLQKRGALTSVH